MIQEDFCKKCGQLLQRNLFGSLKAHKFQDGNYCEPCAKIKVEAARKKKK